jgi:hypothetical protein
LSLISNGSPDPFSDNFLSKVGKRECSNYWPDSSENERHSLVLLWWQFVPWFQFIMTDKEAKSRRLEGSPRNSSICLITRGRIIGTHDFTNKTVPWWVSWLNRVEEDPSGLTFQVDSGCWHITTTCGYDDEVKWITSHWFQGQGRRTGTPKSWRYGPLKVCFVSGWWYCE